MVNDLRKNARQFAGLRYSTVMSTILSLRNASISVGGERVVRGLDLDIAAGETHAIMGPNGSGKSTLVNALMGHPAYELTADTSTFGGKNLLEMQPHERAQAGMFLGFQYPKEIAGVTLRSFLFAAYNAQMAARSPDERKISPIKFKKFLAGEMEAIHMDPAFAERALNKGFSGGEKKKAEILQMRILKPKLALLDETDSGLDVDALKIVAEGINSCRTPENSTLLVTHYARILEYVRPDKVHVMIKGRIVDSGGADLALTLEKGGYKSYIDSA